MTTAEIRASLVRKYAARGSFGGEFSEKLIDESVRNSNVDRLRGSFRIPDGVQSGRWQSAKPNVVEHDPAEDGIEIHIIRRERLIQSLEFCGA